MDKPSTFEEHYYEKYAINPKQATDFFYQYAKDVNYIKEQQIKKNIEYKVDTKYGEMDITINLSKPEKTPEEIKRLKAAPITTFPKCFLCKEQEGLFGNLRNPDRANHRLIKLELSQSSWFFQYSPYSYFNEHSILLSEEHSLMQINPTTIANLIDFVDLYPHYIVGSNADLPIVGGSMLSHNHYQAGNYEFPIFKATKKYVKIENATEYFSLNWPLHTVLLISEDKEDLLEKAANVIGIWKKYSNADAHIIAKTETEHNTITPILRKNANKYELYLILRNNRTTIECPTGIFHVAEERHHVKQENIGLIEAMGLAVLPARLKRELEEIANCEHLSPELTKHQILFEAIQGIEPSRRLEKLYELVGMIFVEGLEDCGVFKYAKDEYLKLFEILK